jgi:DNA-binding NarL/FixJ family response regulator
MDSVRPGGRTTTDTIRVALVEDNTQYRQSIAVLLGHASGFTLVTNTNRAETLLAEVQSGSERLWDLVLMDLGLPGMSGIEATRRLKLLLPDVRVVALTVFEEPGTILDAIAAGVDGYLLKKTPANELLAVLRGVIAGGVPLTPGVARTLLDLVRVGGRRDAALSPEPVGRLDLSDREQDVLRGLVRGLSYKQVADECGTSLDTVRTHVRNIYRKLQVHNVAEAVARAIRERLV